MDFIKDWGLIAGIGGIALGVFLILFREVIRKNIFPQLTKSQGFIVILSLLTLVSAIAAFSIYAYIHKIDPDPNPIIVNPGDTNNQLNTTENCITWKKNWNRINDTHGQLGSAGKSYVNKENIQNRISGLDFSIDNDLNRLKESLLAAIESAPKNIEQPHWNMEYTKRIRKLDYELKNKIQDKIIECGEDP